MDVTGFTYKHIMTCSDCSTVIEENHSYSDGYCEGCGINNNGFDRRVAIKPGDTVLYFDLDGLGECTATMTNNSSDIVYLKGNLINVGNNLVSTSEESLIVIPPNGGVEITYTDSNGTYSYTCSTLEGCEIFAYSGVSFFKGSLVLSSGESIYYYGNKIVNNTGDALTISNDELTASLTGEQSLTIGDYIYTNGSISIYRRQTYLLANETVTIKKLSDGTKEIVLTAGTNGCEFDSFISTNESIDLFMISSGSLKIGSIEIQGWFYLFEDCIRIGGNPAMINGITMTCVDGMARIEVDENGVFTILESSISIMLYEGNSFVVGSETLDATCAYSHESDKMAQFAEECLDANATGEAGMKLGKLLADDDEGEVS